MLPRLRKVLRRARPAARSRVPQAFPPGEFYSPVVNAAQVLAEPDSSRIWPAAVEDPVGIDPRADEQLNLLRQLARYRFDPDASTSEPRYSPTNDQFPPHDAGLLYALIRHLRPQRVVEIGCGFSTTVTAAAIADGALDTELTCIEPYPRPFLRDMADDGRIQLRVEKMEHTPPGVFDQLTAGDVCFIDSSHVAKTGSDVVHQLLRVVPGLADEVYVHVHDIFIPEDYPRGWVRNGFNWNEQYLLQAFLVGNRRTHVVAMNHWLALRHPGAVEEAFGPVSLNGSSLWFATGPEPPKS